MGELFFFVGFSVFSNISFHRNWNSSRFRLYFISWSQIEIETNPAFSDSKQAYAAGMLEGALTYASIYNHWTKCVAFSHVFFVCFGTNLFKFNSAAPSKPTAKRTPTRRPSASGCATSSTRRSPMRASVPIDWPPPIGSGIRSSCTFGNSTVCTPAGRRASSARLAMPNWSPSIWCS